MGEVPPRKILDRVPGQPTPPACASPNGCDCLSSELGGELFLLLFTWPAFLHALYACVHNTVAMTIRATIERLSYLLLPSLRLRMESNKQVLIFC